MTSRYLSFYYADNTVTSKLRFPSNDEIAESGRERRFYIGINRFLKEIGCDLDKELPMRVDEDRVLDIYSKDYKVFRKF
jgi:hypothetical protein